MSNLASQRRIAASVLKCGVNRIWFDPDQGSEIENAISREDVRKLVGDGVIRAHAKKGVSRGRARARIAKRSYGHCKGPGRRKGAKGARTPSKRVWIQKIRAIRKVLVELRDSGELDRRYYRILYRRAAGGQYRNVAHMKAQMEILVGRNR
ncbi:Ribosomal protein L19e [anaerobic digester metagenome]